MKSYSDWATPRSTAAKSQTRRQLLIAQGLCPKCGVNKPNAGRRCCAGCLEEQRNADKSPLRSKRAKRIEEGLCVRCGLNPSVEGKQSCEDCREKHRAYERRRVLKKDEERKDAAVRNPADPAAVVAEDSAVLVMPNVDLITETILNFDEMYFPPGGGVKPLFRNEKEQAEAIRKGVTGNEWYYSFHNKRSKTVFS